MAKVQHSVADRTKRFDDLKSGTVFALAEHSNRAMLYMKITMPTAAQSDANTVNLETGVLIKVGRNDLCDPLASGDSLRIMGDA